MIRSAKVWLAVLALGALALVPAACSGGEAEEGAGGGTEAARTVSGGLATTAEETVAGEAHGNASQLVSALPAVGPHIVQTASLRLSVPRRGFDDAVERIRTLAAGLGGFVVSSSASQKRGRLVRGTLVVRVPFHSYARAMSSLAEVGRIEARDESGEDVSQEFVDLEARARHLEAVERQLLALLDRARTVAAALAVQSQLNETQLQLEQVRGRLRFLDDQTAFATISIALHERGAAPLPGNGGWGVVEAWRDGARAFVYVAGRAFVVLAAAAPILLLIVGGVIVGRALRRRPFFRWGASRP